MKAIVVSIALASAVSLVVGDVVDRIAATVNDVAIAESEVRKAMVTSALRPGPAESADAFRTRVLEALVDQHLEYEDAQRFGPAPPDAAEIATAMRGLEDRLRSEGKDPQDEFVRAGLTRDEVRASIERQLLIARYLRERFTPVALADEERAREEYEKFYVPERRAANLTVSPFPAVADEMRKRAQERVFDDEIEKWRRELRQKARVAIYRIPVPIPTGRQRVELSSIEKVTPTRAPTPGATARP
ncbi:MAG TPA: hypothetical protein VKS03_05360 [Thermoanaerobaculia bacterium]|nr:hypothetical protein [Thermoanaerobaculia bacterium]